MITNITDKLKVTGIYKLTYDNGKVYIGQALSIWARAREHNSKNKDLCDKALKKHNATIEVLEIVSDILLLDTIETKWIAFYDSTNKEKGYNICKEGNASGKRGVENINASLTEEQLNQIIDLLINNLTMSYIDIAKQFNVSQATIFRIANGYSYINTNLNYPLRRNNHEFLKKDNILDYFNNEQELLELKDDLFYRWDLSIETDLKDKYQLPLRILHAINQGNLFQTYGDYNYPIRGKNIRNNHNFSLADIENILFDLRNSKMSMTQIGEKYHIHRDTVSKINKGQAYQIKNYSYPAR